MLSCLVSLFLFYISLTVLEFSCSINSSQLLFSVLDKEYMYIFYKPFKKPMTYRKT